MKHMNRIKLLAVLLCALLLLTACSANNETAPEAETDPNVDTEAEDETDAPAIGPVDPVLKNFFTFTSVSANKVLAEATRVEGDLVAQSANGTVIVMRTSKVDAMNHATETFTVYNAQLGKAVLTTTNSYTYRGDYDAFDWDHPCATSPSVSYPERKMDVRMLNFDVYTLVEVAKATITPINGDKQVDYHGASTGTYVETVDFYDIVTTFEYYDVAGQKVAESGSRSGISNVRYSQAGVTVTVAGANVLLDGESGTAISVTDSDSGIFHIGYSAETERYGYYLYQSQPAPNGTNCSFLEVYRKSNHSLVTRYYLESCDTYNAYVLQNGDVLIQCSSRVDKESGKPYDVIVNNEKYTVDTYILDVPSGTVKEISTDYYFQAIWNREDFTELHNLEAKGIYVTENAVNICVAIPIGGERFDQNEAELVVINNDGSVMFVGDKIIPEHLISIMHGNPMGFSILKNGDYLVELGSDVDADRAIVTVEGRVRSYLKSDAVIAGDYVVLPTGIYDYDLNCLYDFDANDVNLEAVIGEQILVTTGTPDPMQSGDLYWALQRVDGVFVMNSAFDGVIVELVEKGNDYVIVREISDGKYILYNVELSHVLTTQSGMDVVYLEDHYVVATTIYTSTGAIPVFYALSE